jgi:Family of unknown function (DUF5681)
MNDDKKGKEAPKVVQAPPPAEPEVQPIPIVDPPMSSGVRVEPNRVPSEEELEHEIADRKKAADNRFKKGMSPNPRGRPRKVERSFTPRQHRRDILRIAEAPMTIRTEKSKKKVSVIEAVIRLTVAKALAGHGPSMNRVVKWYLDAIKEHGKAHPKAYWLLEDTESSETSDPREGDDLMLEYLNRLRKASRRT